MKIRFLEAICTGCHTCDIACLDWKDIRETGIHFRKVSVTETGVFPDVQIHIHNTGCLHCEKPFCLAACPAGAILRDPYLGIVRIEETVCTGCGSCTKACPQNAIYLQAKEGRKKAVKCDGCYELLQEGRQPVCVEACPMRALQMS